MIRNVVTTVQTSWDVSADKLSCLLKRGVLGKEICEIEFHKGKAENQDIAKKKSVKSMKRDYRWKKGKGWVTKVPGEKAG